MCPTLTAALWAVAKMWKQPVSLVDNSRRRTWSGATTAHYSPIKKNKILLFVTTWMDLWGIMLSEIS